LLETASAVLNEQLDVVIKERDNFKAVYLKPMHMANGNVARMLKPLLEP